MILLYFEGFPYLWPPRWSPVDLPGPALFLLGTASSPAVVVKSTHTISVHSNTGMGIGVFVFSVSFLTVPDVQFFFLSAAGP